MVDQGRILTSKSDETIMRESEVLVLRNISDTLAAISQEMVKNREAMTQMRTDVAVLMDRERGHAEVKETLDLLRRRLEAVEARNAKQDGAMSFATLLKDFGPWVVSVFLGLWILIRGNS